MKLPSKLSYTNLAISAGVTLGIVLIAIGFNSAQTGREGMNLPSAIEQLSPGNGDRVLRQSEIVVDFVDGFTGELVIDGIEIETSRLDQLTSDGNSPKPGEQVELPPNAIFDPGNFTLKFEPTEGAVIEKFTQGTHQAVVRYWLEIDGPDKTRTYSWQFSVD